MPLQRERERERERCHGFGGKRQTNRETVAKLKSCGWIGSTGCHCLGCINARGQILTLGWKTTAWSRLISLITSMLRSLSCLRHEGAEMWKRQNKQRSFSWSDTEFDEKRWNSCHILLEEGNFCHQQKTCSAIDFNINFKPDLEQSIVRKALMSVPCFCKYDVFQPIGQDLVNTCGHLVSIRCMVKVSQGLLLHPSHAQ